MVASVFIIRRHRPQVVIGTGGFASGPLLQVAAMMGIPTVVQEQNSYPGITNKLLASKAKKICVAYEGLERFFPKSKIVLTGNPVRQDLVDVSKLRDQAISFFKLDPSKKTILVLGGSLGARRINQLIAKEIENLRAKNVQIIWQCGKLYEKDYMSFNDIKNVNVVTFIERMDLVYAVAAVIISRAGASSVSELCIVGKPVLFIPSPNVSEDHQTKNAQAMVTKNAALMLRETELDQQFESTITDLLNNQELVDTLSENCRKNAKLSATKDIVDEILKLVQ